MEASPPRRSFLFVLPGRISPDEKYPGAINPQIGEYNPPFGKVVINPKSGEY
jgi:hypothetical protein